MRKSAEKESRKLARSQGNFFVRIARKISLLHAPDPIEILDLPQKLHGHIKRKPGVTIEQEIGRRILQIGLLAKNWRFWKVEETTGRTRVWIRDMVNYSKTVDDKQGLSKQATQIASKSLKKGTDKVMKKTVKDFNNGR